MTAAEVTRWQPLLPALLDNDPDEQVVTETLLACIDLDTELAALVDGLADLLEHATAAATRRAYDSDLGHFTAWATRLGLATVPAQPRRWPSTSPRTRTR